MARLIGGEIERRQDILHTLFTDSGRSSLRLALDSGLGGKRILVPDFICPIVPTVLREQHMAIEHYHVREDLSCDLQGVSSADTDILYVVDYFGCRQDLGGLSDPDLTVIEDAVFLPDVQPVATPGPWVGFNSLRKISCLADGSLLRSTMPLRADLRSHAPAPFSADKYRAKDLKHRFLTSGDQGEEEYLSLFRRGEETLDAAKTPHSISDRSMHELMLFMQGLDAETEARRNNWQVLEHRLAELALPLAPDFPSFFLLRLKHRDRVREQLANQRIFLPSHWPNTTNPLGQTLLPLPVDSRYRPDDMEQLADAVLRAAGLN